MDRIGHKWSLLFLIIRVPADMLIMTKGYGEERDDTLFCDSSVYTFLLYFTKFYLCVPDSADIIKLPEEMKDAQRRLRSGSLLFCCVRRRMMAVKRD